MNEVSEIFRVTCGFGDNVNIPDSSLVSRERNYFIAVLNIISREGRKAISTPTVPCVDDMFANNASSL